VGVGQQIDIEVVETAFAAGPSELVDREPFDGLVKERPGMSDFFVVPLDESQKFNRRRRGQFLSLIRVPTAKILGVA